jgi:hypothetical protein
MMTVVKGSTWYVMLPARLCVTDTRPRNDCPKGVHLAAEAICMPCMLMFPRFVLCNSTSSQCCCQAPVSRDVEHAVQWPCSNKCGQCMR